MTNDLRVVFDTNVLVSATLMPRSVPRRAVNTASQCGVVLFSEESLAEFDEVICRPKFDRYVRESNRKEFLASVLEDAESIEVIDSISDCRDPKDNKFLELAVSGDATHLVTGDDDLLVLHPFRWIAILTPQEFLDEFSSDSASELKPWQTVFRVGVGRANKRVMTMPVIVELFGIPRARAGVAAATAVGRCLGDVLVDLAERFPGLAESCLDGRTLRPGFTANIGGERFVTDPETLLNDGDTVLLLSLDAGGWGVCSSYYSFAIFCRAARIS